MRKKSIRKIIGYSLAASPFIALFVLITIQVGVVKGLSFFGLAAAVVAAIFIGTILTEE